MTNNDYITSLLQEAATIPADKRNYFFKTKPGDYAEHDQFMGVSVPAVRLIAKKFLNLSLTELKGLLTSPFNEKRLLALIILTHQYQKANEINKTILYQFFLDNRNAVNNWNLVDASAPLIMGAHLIDKDKNILLDLAQSKNLWDRRIAIVATLYFIRKNSLEWTFKIAILLLHDAHDLIHKATGWMLREAGKKDINQLINFLKAHAHHMPSTMLRYASEKLPKKNE